MPVFGIVTFREVARAPFVSTQLYGGVAHAPTYDYLPPERVVRLDSFGDTTGTRYWMEQRAGSQVTAGIGMQAEFYMRRIALCLGAGWYGGYEYTFDRWSTGPDLNLGLYLRFGKEGP